MGVRASVDLGTRTSESSIPPPAHRSPVLLTPRGVFLNRWPPGADAGSASIVFHVAQEESVAMIVEAKRDCANGAVRSQWTPKARRQGEQGSSQPAAQTDFEAAEEPLVMPLPPTSWPRIFPGI
jgi:hypothetical protein